MPEIIFSKVKYFFFRFVDAENTTGELNKSKVEF